MVARMNEEICRIKEKLCVLASLLHVQQDAQQQQQQDAQQQQEKAAIFPDMYYSYGEP